MYRLRCRRHRRYVFRHRHGLRRHLVLAYGLEGAAVGGVYEQHDDEDAHRGHEHRHEGGKGYLCPADVEGEVGEARVAAQDVGAVGDGAELLPLEDGLDYLGKAERRDGEVVALEPEHGQADEPGEEGGDEAGEYHGQQRAYDEARRGHGLQPEDAVYGLLEGEVDGGVIVLIHAVYALGRDGEDGVGVGADEHEARLAEREEAREAVEQVHGHGDQGVDRALAHDGDEHVEPRGRGYGLVHDDAERIERDEADGGYKQLQQLFVKQSKVLKYIVPAIYSHLLQSILVRQ